ncbi:MAG: type I DNA topoisomerase [Parcubacteria group bacterium]|nr:type I DNA topoisomerase [Parcubacteria group bacterium]
MSKTLIIVESPAKAKTIGGFLGKEYIIESSYGHLRDLPKSKMGIDIEHNFEPRYIIARAKSKIATRLKKIAHSASTIIFATDEDREGEAITWHLMHIFGLEEEVNHKNRIVFHEITKAAIEKALQTPRAIDINLVNAQQGRRVLDRLVGYELSPLLWKKVARGLSAGRVQSAALRMVVEREQERRAFVAQEYWTIEGLFKKEKKEFSGILFSVNDAIVDKFDISNKEKSDAILDDCANVSDGIVQEIKSREESSSPPPPFSTSSLQQQAYRELHFQARKTMMIAQQLYEGIEIDGQSTGLITYMRTDSLHISEDFIGEARAFIEKEYGMPFLSDAPRRYKTKAKLAQEAHEAIRPTNAARMPLSIKNFLTNDHYRLYDLIWRRAVATQMKEARKKYSDVLIECRGKKEKYIFKAKGVEILFDGFLVMRKEKSEETILPMLEKGDSVDVSSIEGSQHFTEPSARFNDASLVKALEEYGIGRPSTYSSIISTLLGRNYMKRQQGFAPTEIGEVVNSLLVTHFPKIVDYAFTARIEEELDEIAEGKLQWQNVVRAFYTPFKELVEKKKEEINKQTMVQSYLDEKCPGCGNRLMKKFSRFGPFIACEKFPECRYIKKEKKEVVLLDVACPECKEGKVAERKNRRGKIFYGCSRYPDCKFVSSKKPEE